MKFASAEGETEQRFMDTPGKETEDSQDLSDYEKGTATSGPGRRIKEWEKLQGMTYRKVTLLTHLLNLRRIHPNAYEQARMMAAFMYYVLYEQITCLQKSQTDCAAKQHHSRG